MTKPDGKGLPAGMREQLEAAQAAGELAGLEVDALSEAMEHPMAAAAVAALLEVEARSVTQGSPAPDFTLPWLPGAEGGDAPTLTLSDHFGKEPVALIFGSYT